jgi:hypothetical protein
MANVVQALWKQEVMQGTANTSLTGTLKFVLARSAVNTYSAAQQFRSDITSPHATLSDAVASKTFANGVFDSADLQFTAPANDGNTYNQLYLVVETGTASTSRIVAFWDTGVTGLPVTPNGGNVALQTPSNIFTL